MWTQSQIAEWVEVAKPLLVGGLGDFCFGLKYLVIFPSDWRKTDWCPFASSTDLNQHASESLSMSLRSCNVFLVKRVANWGETRNGSSAYSPYSISTLCWRLLRSFSFPSSMVCPYTSPFRNFHREIEYSHKALTTSLAQDVALGFSVVVACFANASVQRLLIRPHRSWSHHISVWSLNACTNATSSGTTEPLYWEVGFPLDCNLSQEEIPCIRFSISLSGVLSRCRTSRSLSWAAARFFTTPTALQRSIWSNVSISRLQQGQMASSPYILFASYLVWYNPWGRPVLPFYYIWPKMTLMECHADCLG